MPDIYNKQKNKQGFTLVELSIVLVIIGLLIGGILTAQSLIDSTKKMQYIKELQLFKFHYEDFKDKFGQIPGDFSKRIQVFGGTVDGNNNGLVNWGANEANQFWNDLFWNYENLDQEFNSYYAYLLRDENAPSQTVAEYYYSAAFVDTGSGGSGWRGNESDSSAENAIYLANWVGGQLNGVTMNSVELVGVDKKTDDGFPFTGNLRGHQGQNLEQTGFTTCNQDVGGTQYYKLDEEELNCRMIYLIDRY